jgi:hypothetical protein
LRTDHAREKLFEAVKPFAPGDSEFYVVFDEVDFSMLAKRDAEKVCLIRPDHSAIHAIEHPSFEVHRSDSPEHLRIFTLREAVDAVVACIENS